jgi:drug/metabolite transporter (DMT)-like permease
MSVTLCMFTLGGVAARELAHAGLSVFQITFLRSIFAGVLLLPLILRSRGRIARSSNMKLQVLRNLFHMTGSLGWYYGVGILPLATVVALEFTTPLWLALIAVLLLGEKMNVGRAIAMALGFAGVLIIVRPGVVGLDFASIVVLGAAASHACAKYLSARDSVQTILFYMVAVSSVATLVPAVLTWAPVSPVSWLWVCIMAGTVIGAHSCLTRALRLADATVVIPMDFLRVPLTAAVGFLAYAEVVDPFLLIGTLVIFLGNFYSVRRERRAAPATAAVAK